MYSTCIRIRTYVCYIHVYSIAGKIADLYFGDWWINYEIVKIDSAILLYSEPAQ